MFNHGGASAGRRSRLVATCLLALVCAVRAGAFQIDVTTDSGGTGGPDCTIRDAITAANMDAPVGGCPAGSGPDIIVLAAPLYSLSQVDNVTDGPNGLPSITSDIAIEGNGAIIERAAGSPSFRIFHVDTAGTLTLQEVTVRNGAAADGASRLIPDRGENGGGIFNAGTLDLEASTVTDNAAGNGGDGDASPGAAGGDGGGIYNSGDLSVVDSTVDSNFAGRGGFFAGHGGNGGGIANEGGVVRLINSTVSGNAAGGAGGGIFHASGIPGDGGGLYDLGGSATLANATIVANHVVETVGFLSGSGQGAGLFTGVSSPVLIGNTIVAGNTVAGANMLSDDCTTVTPLDSSGYNLFGLGTGGCTIAGNTTGNQFVQNAEIGPLADNGGPTETHALLPGSPAIDAGTPQPLGGCTDLAGTPLTTDQRGEPRPQGIRCDIGAFEAPFMPSPAAAPLLSIDGLVAALLTLFGVAWLAHRRRA